MLKHGWIWWICFLLLAGCMPMKSTPMISTPMPITSTPTLMPWTPTPITSTPKPQALVVNEYLLDYGPSVGTDQLVFHFANGDQKEILARTEEYRDYDQQSAEYNNKILKSFDYRQENYQKEQFEGSGYFFWHSNIYHGDEKIVSDALFVKPVSVNTSGTDFITEVTASDGENYLLTSNSYEKRPWPPGRESYAYVGDQLLSIESTSTAHQQGLISVYLDDSLAYQSQMFAARATYGITDGPWSYNGHWALVILDGKQDSQGNDQQATRVIQDGQDLNTVKGYEQSFQFTVLDDRPFFFYQKNEKIGISFDGQEIAANYDEIPHYNCCSFALTNPRISMNMIWFFAKRGEDWYYVGSYVPFEDAK